MNSLKFKLSAMMFIEWFIWGAWFVPLWQYLNHIGFSTSQIAWSYSCTSIAAIVSPVFVGVVADRYFSAQKVLSILHFVGAVLLFIIARQNTFESFIPALILYTLSYMPTVALTNSISFRNLENAEQDFPRIRVLGTIGWIFSGVCVGFVPSLLGFGDISDTSIPLMVAALAAMTLAIFSLFLPDTPPQDGGGKVDVGELLGLNALTMFKDRSFAVFAVCSFLLCIPLAFYYQFANGYLTQVGLKNATGWMSLGQFSEIVFLLALPFFLRRYGIKKVLLLGLVTAAVRYGIFMVADTENILMVALLFTGILLHGASYDFYFITAYIYTDKKSPLHMRTSAQGLITLITMGFGALAGNQLGGATLEHYTYAVAQGDETFNWFGVWGFGASIIVVVTILFVFLFRDKEQHSTNAAVNVCL